MNNLPLQPLKWHEQQGWFSTKSPLTEYQIAKQSDKYRVLYIKRSDQFAREATGFATIEEAKAWAWKHYNEKMQPYVKPSPTWIDASEQLPQVDVDTQFMCAYDSAIEPYVKVTYFDKSLNEFDHEHEGVLAWMPIPEFSTMQNLHKGE